MRAIFVLLFLCSPVIAAPVPKELKVPQASDKEERADQNWPWPTDGQGILELNPMTDVMPSIIAKHRGDRIVAVRKLMLANRE